MFRRGEIFELCKIALADAPGGLDTRELACFVIRYTATLKSYKDSLGIRERLTNSNPGNAQWQRDIIISYKKIADCSPPKERQANLSRALEIAQALHTSHPPTNGCSAILRASSRKRSQNSDVTR